MHALVSINDLADDLLCDIFLLCLTRDGWSDRFKIADIRLKGLISICLVCKRWLDLAYNYPLLWTRVIDFEGDTADCIARLLERSGSAPFEIGVDSPFDAVQQKSKRSVDVLRTIFEHRSRIRNMNLSIRYAPWDFICQNFLEHPAPNLEFLNLITSCPFPDCSFSGPLFANHAPRLTQFHMQRCLTDFSSPVLHNLTALSVSDIVAPGQLFRLTENSVASVAPTVDGWLQILRNIPALRFLALVNSITRTDNNLDTTKCSDVSLPSLRLFSLTASLHEGAVLLEFLKIPPSCGIRLRCKDRDPAAQVGPILAALSNQLSHSQNLPKERQYLQAKLLDGDRIHFGNSSRIGQPWNISEPDELSQHAETSVDPLVWLILTFTNDFPTARRLFRQLLALYEPSFSSTTHLDLWIDEQSIVTPQDVAFLSTLANFSAFTAVQKLGLYGQSVIHLLPLFDSLSQPNDAVFPSLRLMELTGTIFNDRDNQMYRIVLNFFLRRRTLNAPVWRIIICNGEISPRTRSKLQEKSKVEVIGVRKDQYGYAEVNVEGMNIWFPGR